MKNAFLRTITPFSKNMGGCGGTVLRCLFTACPKRGRLGSPLCSCGLVHGHLRYSVVETRLHTQDRVRVEAVTAASVRGESRLGPRHPPRTSRPAPDLETRPGSGAAVSTGGTQRGCPPGGPSELSGSTRVPFPVWDSAFNLHDKWPIQVSGSELRNSLPHIMCSSSRLTQQKTPGSSENAGAF